MNTRYYVVPVGESVGPTSPIFHWQKEAKDYANKAKAKGLGNMSVVISYPVWTTMTPQELRKKTEFSHIRDEYFRLLGETSNI